MHFIEEFAELLTRPRPHPSRPRPALSRPRPDSFKAKAKAKNYHSRKHVAKIYKYYWYNETVPKFILC